MAVALTNTTNRLTSKTSELKNWIRKIKTKKVVCKRRRRSDLYMDAVLRHTLKKAETELHAKQQQRKQRWQQMRTMAAAVTSPAFLPSVTMPRSVDVCADAKETELYDAFDEPKCEAICRLDDFLDQLKLVKCNVRK